MNQTDPAPVYVEPCLFLNPEPGQPRKQWIMPDGSRVEAVPPPFPLPPGVVPLPPLRHEPPWALEARASFQAAQDAAQASARQSTPTHQQP